MGRAGGASRGDSPAASWEHEAQQSSHREGVTHPQVCRPRRADARGLLGTLVPEASQLGPFLQGGPGRAAPLSLPGEPPALHVFPVGLQWGPPNLLAVPSTQSPSRITLALPLLSQPCCGCPVLLGAVTPFSQALGPPLSQGSLRPPGIAKVEEVPRVTHALGPGALQTLALPCVLGLVNESWPSCRMVLTFPGAPGSCLGAPAPHPSARWAGEYWPGPYTCPGEGFVCTLRGATGLPRALCHCLLPALGPLSTLPLHPLAHMYQH